MKNIFLSALVASFMIGPISYASSSVGGLIFAGDVVVFFAYDLFGNADAAEAANVSSTDLMAQLKKSNKALSGEQLLAAQSLVEITEGVFGIINTETLETTQLLVKNMQRNESIENIALAANIHNLPIGRVTVAAREIKKLVK